MTRDEVMTQLGAWGTEGARTINARHGAGENQFGVNLSLLRGLAKTLKKDHPLAMELWATGNVEARLLATFLLRPRELSREDVERMVGEVSYFKIVDWLVVNVLKAVPFVEELRGRWIDSPGEYVGRAGWSLTTPTVGALADVGPLLDRIEAEMKATPYRKQEAMNHCLAEIGIQRPEHRARCLAIGERLGVFKDYPTPKGCISPYAPTWITSMVERRGNAATPRR